MKEIVIFGIGYYMMHNVPKINLNQYKIRYLCDNDPDKWGKTYHVVEDIICISPEELKSRAGNIPVCIAVESQKTYHAIAEQLDKMNVKHLYIKELLEEHKDAYEKSQIAAYKKKYERCVMPKEPLTMHHFIDCFLPLDFCNLSCDYCYVGQSEKYQRQAMFVHSPEFIAHALGIHRLGGTSFINLCSDGETMLYPGIVEIAEQLIKQGHFVQIVTNGTVSKELKKLGKLKKEILDQLMMKFSLHYLELKKRNLLEVFAENVMWLYDQGASITIELVPYDDLEPYIDEIVVYCEEQFGAKPHLTVTRDESTSEYKIFTSHTKEEFYQIWRGFDCAMFEIKMDKVYKRYSTCRAGELSYVFNMGTGQLYQCNGNELLMNLYDNLTMELEVKPVMDQCKNPYCYNCHSFLSIGVIDEVMDAPTYFEVRNRKMKGGRNWVHKKAAEYFSLKLKRN
ncbi:MAG: radical SAM protein [Eubacterium sp.]|nr:radical SAM protein [Eubacterium sp.]